MSEESNENQLQLTGCRPDWQGAGVMRSGSGCGGKKEKGETAAFPIKSSQEQT